MRTYLQTLEDTLTQIGRFGSSTAGSKSLARKVLEEKYNIEIKGVEFQQIANGTVCTHCYNDSIVYAYEFNVASMDYPNNAFAVLRELIDRFISFGCDKIVVGYRGKTPKDLASSPVVRGVYYNGIYSITGQRDGKLYTMPYQVANKHYSIEEVSSGNIRNIGIKTTAEV